jgi:putative ABC transport system substrate-binding protein
LRERGWIDGQNIVVELRFADGKVERLPVLVAELINIPQSLLLRADEVIQ